MENLKRSVKRLITRLTILGLVVICGAIAIAQANYGRILPASTPETAAVSPEDTATQAQRFAPITIPDDAVPTGEPSFQVSDEPEVEQVSRFSEPRLVEDNRVMQTQAVEEVPSRFDEPFDAFPAAQVEPSESQNRFVNTSSEPCCLDA